MNTVQGAYANSGRSPQSLLIRDSRGYTPLHYSASWGNAGVTDFLLSQSQDIQFVDSTDNDGSTPLFYSASDGNEEVVRQLVAAGADINKQNYKGESPLLVASAGGHGPVVQFLIESGANPNLVSQQEVTSVPISILCEI